MPGSSGARFLLNILAVLDGEVPANLKTNYPGVPGKVEVPEVVR